MHAGSTPSWVIRENASTGVLLALYLREVLGIASPAELPRLRDVGRIGSDPVPRDVDAHDALEKQWREWWAMTVEPEDHPSPVPLELIDEYGTAIALPVSGAEALAASIRPHAEAALAWADWAHERYRTASAARSGDTYRAYAGTIAEHEREVGGARTRSSSTSRCSRSRHPGSGGSAARRSPSPTSCERMPRPSTTRSTRSSPNSPDPPPVVE